MRSCLLVLLVACSTPAAVKPAAGVAAVPPSTSPVDRGLEPPAPSLRLPRNFVPTGYAATLAVDPASAGFEGAIAITGEVAERSSVIWLHGRQLAIQHAAAVRGGAEVRLTATRHGEDLLELRAATPLDAGPWTLAIDYTGSYDLLSTAGAFKQIVRGAPYIYTQFQPMYARRVFPCLDEPDRKVPWQLTLDVPADQVAVSNTPIAREQPLGGGKKRVVFARTRPLPSYLVAFGVGPFDVVDAGKTASGTPVRIVAMQGRAADTAYAAKTTAKLLDLLEEFFGSPYPYEKLDMLAFPVTTGFGAMENAGLITCQESTILIDPERGGRRAEHGWIVNAAHELAHQWFGDLVTTAWWDDIWLNEGFATWVQRKISGRFEPSWHEELGELSVRRYALDQDGLTSARQVRQPIVTTDDIVNAFDYITYSKGASVLDMLEGYLGHHVFMRGVRDYLAQHAYGNATSPQFTRAISDAAGKDVSAAFTTFLEQPGAPEITATAVCERGRPPRIELGQRRYVPPGAATPPATRPWIVPVCVTYDRAGRRGEACTMLDAAAGSLELDAPSCPRWVMPNLRGRGYYRIAYTGAQLTALRDLAWPQLEPSERGAMFADLADAAMLGKLPLALAMSFVPRQLAAGDRFSIGAALRVSQRVRRFVPDELRPAYEGWLRRTFGAAAHQAGLSPRDGDSLDVESMRNDLVGAVADAGRDPALNAEAVKLSGRWRDLPQSVRGMVLRIAAHASPAVFDRLYQEVFTETDLQRRGELLEALATSRDVKQQTAALGLMLDDRVDIRETRFLVFSVNAEINRKAAQQFVRDHKDELLRRLPADDSAGNQAFLARVFGASCEAAQRDEIADYVTRAFAGMPGGPRTVKQAIEEMDQCIAGRKLVEPEIRGWLGGGSAAPRPR
jgi:alanyl aminopeptidase